MDILKSITPGPAIVLKGDRGQTWEPPTIRVHVVLYVAGKKRWGVTVPLENRKADIVEAAASAVPDHFRRFIVSAELRPAINPLAGGVVAQIRFDCQKDGM